MFFFGDRNAETVFTRKTINSLKFYH